MPIKYVHVCLRVLVCFSFMPQFAVSAELTEAENSAKVRVETDAAPAAIGPYSQGIRFGDFLFSSGQIAINPDTGTIVDGGVEPQTRQVFSNLSAILAAGNFAFEDVVQVQVFLKNIADYAVVNTIYEEYFDAAPPARAVVEVSRLPRDALIEVMVIAAK